MIDLPAADSLPRASERFFQPPFISSTCFGPEALDGKGRDRFAGLAVRGDLGAQLAGALGELGHGELGDVRRDRAPGP